MKEIEKLKIILERIIKVNEVFGKISNIIKVFVILIKKEIKGKSIN